MRTKKTLRLSPTTSHKMAAKPNSKQHMGWALILPALLSVMTRNITKAIDDKLSSLTKTIQMLDAQIQDTNGPLDEVGSRQTRAKGCGVGEAVQVSAITERLDMVTSPVKDDNKSRLHEVGECPSHPCTQAGIEQETQAAAAAVLHVQ